MKLKLIFLLSFIALSSVAIAQDETKPCKGTTKQNVPCKRKVSKGDYCFSHNPNAFRCGAPTSKKVPCKFAVAKEGDKCRNHKSQ
jgi:hypothetical protein